ncbi:ABC transporter permease [Pararhodobacter sp.]|uniref:ABC transporter permease n=1 Tax=Pararhodobacter sp. TaxID=2127056 RepID=UPI002FDD76CB
MRQAASASLPGFLPRLLGSPWPGFLLRRLAGVAAGVLMLIALSFVMVQLIPGDPAVILAGEHATAAMIDHTRQQLGLDRALGVQFIAYAAMMLQGEFGTSFRLGIPVLDVLMVRLPYTISLATAGIVLVLAVAVPMGVTVGVLTRNGRRAWLDVGFGVVTGFLTAVPGYVKATLLILFLGIWAGLLPPSFSGSAPVVSMIMPLIALALGPICVIARVLRRETADVLEQDFMRTARGWRLGAAKLYVKYALPNLLTTTLTLSAMLMTSMIGSAVVIETVFSIPGVGRAVVEAIANRDYPLIQGAIIMIGTVALFLHLLVDILLGLFDPRTLGGRR